MKLKEVMKQFAKAYEEAHQDEIQWSNRFSDFIENHFMTLVLAIIICTITLTKIISYWLR